MTLEKPSVCHLGGTQLDKLGLGYFLEILGASKWGTDPCADGEKLVEVAGRVCYRSFVEGLNPNVVRYAKATKSTWPTCLSRVTTRFWNMSRIPLVFA
jgi:hypothetical protein